MAWAWNSFPELQTVTTIGAAKSESQKWARGILGSSKKCSLNNINAKIYTVQNISPKKQLQKSPDRLELRMKIEMQIQNGFGPIVDAALICGNIRLSVILTPSKEEINNFDRQR